MKFLRRYGLPVLAAVLIAGSALGASNTFVTSIGDLVFPFAPPGVNSPNSGGSIGDVARGGMAPVNGVDSYTKVVPLTGFNLTFGNFQRTMILIPAGTLAAGYAVMPPAPVDGHEACVFSTAIVTLFYPTANTGQTLAQAVTTLGANGKVCYTYSKANTTWNRSQ